MLALSAPTIQSSFVNASKKEVSDLTLPTWLDRIAWADLDYLGWRDPKIGRRAYVVVPGADDGVTGILLKQAETSPRSRAQCSWCRDIKLPNDVVFYSARKAGPSGRSGDTVGTLVCQDFQCSENVRRMPPLAYTGFDLEAARAERIDALRLHSAGFVAAVSSRVSSDT